MGRNGGLKPALRVARRARTRLAAFEPSPRYPFGPGGAGVVVGCVLARTVAAAMAGWKGTRDRGRLAGGDGEWCVRARTLRLAEIASALAACSFEDIH